LVWTATVTTHFVEGFQNWRWRLLGAKFLEAVLLQ
jgi:hypothetical protein